MAVVITGEPTVVADPGRRRGVARFSQFVDYAFWLLYTLLFIRLTLAFFHARSGAGFTRFIDVVTNPFYGPFRGIAQSQDVEGGFTVAVPVLIALLVYGVLHLAINKLLRVAVYRKTTL